MRRILVLVVLLLVWGCVGRAQDAPQPLQIGGVTFSGSVRERYEVWIGLSRRAGIICMDFRGR